MAAWVLFVFLFGAWFNAAQDDTISGGVVVSFFVLMLGALAWALWEHRRPRR